jgi:hypothetical protein
VTATWATAARAADGVRGWLSVRHSWRVEAAMVLGLYALYETTRGVVAGGPSVALRHAHDVVAVERSLHVFVEGAVQRAAERVPGAIGTLGLAYLTLHLAVTGFLLVWLHRRRPAAYPFVRTTLLLASGLAIVGYAVFPTAPPRLSDLGILDTISGQGRVNLDKGLVSALYNPYAAVPSMHAGYALVVGSTLVHQGRHLMARLAGAVYPVLIILVIVATGNHFLLDAAAGMLVVALAAGASWMVLRRSADAPGRRSDGAATYWSLRPLQTRAGSSPSAESPAPRPWPPGSPSVSEQPRIPQVHGP